ncbi:hypothetical protein [Chondromyces crocatus]|nr:hypothetical protein [Chondromyces crocatus]
MSHIRRDNNLLVYVTVAGSKNGLGGTPRTDLVAARSLSGGESFSNPHILTPPPLPHNHRWQIDYPTAAAVGEMFHLKYSFVSLWRQTRIINNVSAETPTWQLSLTDVRFLNPVFQIDKGPVEVPIPPTAGQAKVVARRHFPIENPSNHETDVYILYPTYDDAQATCPSGGTVSVEWKLISSSSDSDFTVWTPAETVASASTWVNCVGASRGTSGTPWNKQLVRPDLGIDHINGTLYAAIGFNETPTSFARVRVYKKIAGLSWQLMFEPSSVDAASGLPVHDQWSPALAVARYHDQPTARVGLTWYTTQDWSNNSMNFEDVHRFGTMSFDGGATWHSPTGGQISGFRSIVGYSMGHYQGLAAYPHNPYIFVTGWTDQRSLLNEPPVVHAASFWP